MKSYNNSVLNNKSAMREEQLRRYKTIAYLFLLIIVSLLIVLTIIKINKTNTKAFASLNGEYSYSSVMVEEGDTLYSIARKYSTEYPGSTDAFIREVRTVNNLNSDNIYAGQYIIIPVFNNYAD
ncbi:MAG: LysM peptidoglycan-binding domain-containing protein [Lachnospiraceae bacterium]|nr:LysM peptidoglycan-binding domain-containing protein [Lachnospiraceae bacterium]